MGFKLAPDGKIYLATSYYQYYPYKDTMYNNTNMYLSTINSPNNLGSACDLQPTHFILVAKELTEVCPIILIIHCLQYQAAHAIH
jgi:hypothetical protein